MKKKLQKKPQKKSKKKNFYSRAGQDGRSDEDKQTIIFWGLTVAPDLERSAHFIVTALTYIGESWSPQNHSYPEKMFPSNVLISLEAEKKSSFTHWKSP